jgi:hypothetical protein
MAGKTRDSLMVYNKESEAGKICASNQDDGVM